MSKVPAKQSLAMVARSQNVPKLKNYNDYKPYLRRDFIHSCAYCTMTESEAQAIRFTIDHYEPQRARPELSNEYTNLMYCCGECNLRKGDRTPPDAARRDGIRFFKADNDAFDEHFSLVGIRLESKSSVGDYSIDAIDLNRPMVRRLRELRKSKKHTDEMVAAGLLALRNAPLDRLPRDIRGRVVAKIKQAQVAQAALADAIEGVLSECARSDLMDLPADAPEEQKKRLQSLSEREALYPGAWRGRDIER